MKLLALLPLILSTLAAALVAPRQAVETGTARVIAVSVLGGDDYTILPPTVTAAPQTGADIVQVAEAAESTTTHTASIIQAVIPHEKDKIYIFPFHVEITESCSRSSPSPVIKGWWSNGDYAVSFNLDAGKSLSIYHWIAGFPNFQLGPFDTGAETLRFRYENTVFYKPGNVCNWTDGETWRECGECRAALWSGPPLNCGAGGGVERTKRMDCSFIMGWKSQAIMGQQAPMDLPTFNLGSGGAVLGDAV